MMWRKCFSALAVVALIAGCGPGFDSKSGEDSARGKPIEVVLGKLSYDRVSAEDGDNTDWKVFELSQPTKITVRIWWDNPEIKSNLFIRGRTTEFTRTLTHKKGQRAETMGPFALTPGKWFLRIRAESGASVYSLQIDAGAAGPAGGGIKLPDF